MKNNIVLYRDGEPHFWTKTGTELYVSPDEFRENPVEVENFFREVSHIFVAISFDFAASILTQKSSSRKGLYLAEAEPAAPDTVFVFQPESGQPLIGPRVFMRQVRSLQEMMRRGDFYLANLTFPIRVKIGTRKDTPLPVSDFGGSFALPDREVCSLSPENFLKIEAGWAHTFPIKGSLAGRLSSHRLRNNPKEMAEQTMVTDLMRNDLGQICSLASVQVDAFCETKKHHGLWQMYSHIRGRLRSKTFLLADLLKILPAGSITGTPKMQVCETLAATEKWSRSFYTGVYGVFDNVKQRGNFSILIRALEISSDSAIFGTGCGITVDSDPEQEYQECLLKFQSFQSQFHGESYEKPHEDSQLL